MSIAFLIVLLVFVIGFQIRRYVIINTSDSAYTICEFYENYVSAKALGKKFQYFVKGKKYIGICTSNKCVNADIGSRHVVRYQINYPNMVKIYFQINVPDTVIAPFNGWNELPIFK